MREIRNYRPLNKVKIRWIVICQDLRKYATASKWDKTVWAAYLSALLKGRALDVYDRLSPEDAVDYDKLKDALLKHFDMTERGFRKKFRYSRPESSEIFIQFSNRLCSYLNKWLTMAKVEIF